MVKLLFLFPFPFNFSFSLFPFPGFSQPAKRVISLAPSITENIYLLGAQDKLVGCTSYCTPAVNNGKEQVGSTIDINIEKILMLKPDLVLAMTLTKPQDLATMKKLGLKVELFQTPGTSMKFAPRLLILQNCSAWKTKPAKLLWNQNKRLTA
ncbi:MAG: ABC transporter substrate-binding protein [Draconibacterium sp.]|nr:ABC transporter substrate-binding protein [Draconibacterium sp.]